MHLLCGLRMCICVSLINHQRKGNYKGFLKHQKKKLCRIRDSTVCESSRKLLPLPCRMQDEWDKTCKAHVSGVAADPIVLLHALACPLLVINHNMRKGPKRKLDEKFSTVSMIAMDSVKPYTPSKAKQLPALENPESSLLSLPCLLQFCHFEP